MKEIWRALRIFNYPWHTSHQFSLMHTLPHSEWYLYEPPYRRWGYEARDLPPNVRFVPFYEEGKYDFALLHVDGECADPEGQKGALYRKMNDMIQDIPKIVINHGTPFLPEYFSTKFKYIKDDDQAFKAAVSYCRDQMKLMIGDNSMIVNSKQAAKDWGFGIPIIHGMANSPDEEYWDIDKIHRILFIVSPAGWSYYYNRPVMEEIKRIIGDCGPNPVHVRVDETPRNFDDYRKLIGTSLIGIFPFRESPMPRSRTEFMLSGGCTISTKNHDIGDYFDGLEFKKTSEGRLIKDEHGNIIPVGDVNKAEIVWCDVDRAIDAAEKAMWLYRNPRVAKKIGQNGKKKAQQVFDIARYRSDWHKLLTKEGIL